MNRLFKIVYLIFYRLEKFSFDVSLLFSSAASHFFPYVKKRIQVVSQTSTELNPIEVAIDEMSKKISELNQLCTMEEVDMIRLQLKLQGSVSVKVSVAQPSRCHLCVVVLLLQTFL